MQLLTALIWGAALIGIALKLIVPRKVRAAGAAALSGHRLERRSRLPEPGRDAAACRALAARRRRRHLFRRHRLSSVGEAQIPERALAPVRGGGRDAAPVGNLRLHGAEPLVSDRLSCCLAAFPTRDSSILSPGLRPISAERPPAISSTNRTGTSDGMARRVHRPGVAWMVLTVPSSAMKIMSSGIRVFCIQKLRAAPSDESRTAFQHRAPARSGTSAPSRGSHRFRRSRCVKAKSPLAVWSTSVVIAGCAAGEQRARRGAAQNASRAACDHRPQSVK